MSRIDIFLVVIIWFIIACFNWHKQLKCWNFADNTELEPNDKAFCIRLLIVFGTLFAPIYFMVAVVRQTIINDWQ